MQKRAKIGTNLGEAFLKAYAHKYGVKTTTTDVQPIKTKNENTKISLSEYEQNDLVRIYESGGNRMRHISSTSYQLLCSVWGIYVLTPKGINLASDFAGV